MCKYLVLFLAPAVLAQSISPSGGSGSSGNSTGISAQKASTTSFTVTSSSAAGFGDTRYSIPASSTCTVTASAVDAIYVYVNASGNLVNATASATVSCSPSATSVTASAFPADVVQIATIAVLANGTLGTLTPLYVGGVAKTVTCSSGCTVTETSTGIGISTTAITGGTCTNQATTAISTTGVPTCTTLSSAYVDSSIQPSATAVTLTGAQTLTNKTLTAPELTSPTVGGNLFTLSAPLTTTGTGALTLTNPTGAAQTITMPNAASVTLARTDAGQTFTGPQTFSTEADFGGSTSGFVKIGTTNGWLLGYANSQTIQASSNGIIGFTTGAPFTNPIDTSISRFGAGVLAIGTGAQGNTSGSLYVASTAIGPSNTSPGTGTGTFLDRTATTGATTVCIGCDFASHTSATTTQVTIQAGTGQGTTVALLTPNISVTSTSVPASGYGMNLSSSNTLGFYAGGQEIIQAYTSNLIIAGTASGSSQTGSIIINNNNNHALLLQSTGTSGISSPFSNDQAVVYGPYSAGGMLIGTGQANAPITFVTNNVSRMSVSDTGVSIGTIVYNGNSPPTNSVVCYKAGGVLGYATNTSGVIGTTCN